jgi:hypothetical protein
VLRWHGDPGAAGVTRAHHRSAADIGAAKLCATVTGCRNGYSPGAGDNRPTDTGRIG